MVVAKFAGIAMAGMLNVVMFLFHPFLGAVGLPFAIGIAITLLKDMTKIAGALYILMFGLLIAGLNLIAGIIALFVGCSVTVRMFLRQ